MNCPACAVKRLHSLEDWTLHPYAGHGYVKGQGWTHPDLADETQAAGAVGLATANLGGGVVGVETAPAGGSL